MPDSSTQELKNFFIQNFNYLSDEDAQTLAKHCKKVVYNPGDNLIDSERYETSIFFIIDGLLRGYKYVDEYDEYNIFFSESGKTIMSPEKFFYKEKKLNTVVFKAITTVTCLKFDHDELIQLANQSEGIFEYYHDSLKQITSSLYERIQLLLIENAEERYKYLANTRPEVIKHAHKKHLAQFLGITPNSYSRLMRKIQTEQEK